MQLERQRERWDIDRCAYSKWGQRYDMCILEHKRESRAQEEREIVKRGKKKEEEKKMRRRDGLS